MWKFLQLAVWIEVAATARGDQSEMGNPIELPVAVGSSVLLPGFTDQHFQNVDHVKWTFSQTRILNYDEATQTATFINSYKNRCTFYRSNGSLLLRNITRNDEGRYEVQINLNEIRSRMIQLKVFEPVSEPLIFSNSTYVDTTIGLACQVSAKNVSSVLWWKDGKVITNDQRYQLTEDNWTMVIKKAIKSDCGVYTCTVENAVSKKNTSHSLAIYGLPPLIHHTMVLSIVALISATAIFFGIILQCLHNEMQKMDFQRKALLFLQVAAMLSFIILFAALLCWLQAGGTSAVTVFMLVILSLLLILTTLSACSMNGWVIETFKQILNTKCCRVTLDAVTPMGGLIVICTSSILLWEINKLAGKGCEPSPDLHLRISLAVVVPIVISVLIFGIYVRQYRKQRKERPGGAQSANGNQEGPAQSQPSEEGMPLQAVSGGDGTSRRASANEEESS
ncbi:uncharacterized protein [Scyliorhinus torazame]|uniref:uncharacterized protein n=1 Tax=Scyliorhinus torazame TaxID=75743 RepID=UPI003B59441A